MSLELHMPPKSRRLNPFEFRASIQLCVSSTGTGFGVSIPLNSGHRFNSRIGDLLLGSSVSIPLNSGHRFNRSKRVHMHAAIVSIPLNSGHRFNARTLGNGAE